MKCDLYSLKNGAAVGSLDVNEGIFGGKVNDHLVYEAIRAELANARQGTVMTKGRSDVNGSRSKLYRQKGTGRARAGYAQSPTRVGGGVSFGPKPRDYRIRLSRKIRQAAMVSLLSMKTAQGAVRVIEDFDSESGKTREMNKMLLGLTKAERVVVIVRNASDKTRRAIRNIPWVRCYDSARLVYKDLFYAREILVTKSAVADIEAHYAGAVKGE